MIVNRSNKIPKAHLVYWSVKCDIIMDCLMDGNGIVNITLQIIYHKKTQADMFYENKH